MVMKRRIGDKQIVVSLTSYPPRFKGLPQVVSSLRNQSMQPDLIVLWINKSDAHLLPDAVRLFEDDQFKIVTITGSDIKSYKKLIPARSAFPDAHIVTCDDDVMYYINWLWDLYVESLARDHSAIICHRARIVREGNDGYFPYRTWPFCDPYTKSEGLNLFPTGIGGVFYPQQVFNAHFSDYGSAMRLAPKGDDIWFYFAGLITGTLKVKIPSNFENPPLVAGSQDVALWKDNLTNDGNDPQIKLVQNHFRSLLSNQQFNSARYWERRYQIGGNSGAGSYNRLAQFKAETINAFVKSNNVNSVVEFGVGDGNQLRLAEYPRYKGFDVASTAVAVCREIFSSDPTKSFELMDSWSLEKFDLALSLDVIYHLIEDDVFNNYMSRLFDSASSYVMIYASNYNSQTRSEHVRHRKVSDWIDENRKDFRLIEVRENKYPFDESNPNNTSFSQFFIYESTYVL